MFGTTRALFSLTRPLEWGKPFANMLLGYFTALLLAGTTTSADFVLLAIGVIIICPLFWGGLYILNDWTDWRNDQKHSAKKDRAIASGKVSPQLALAFGVFLVIVSFGFAFFMNNALLLLSMAIMLVNQWLYTMEPFYLKRRIAVDMVSGAIINPIFRFLAGWALATQAISTVPVFLLVFVSMIQYVFYSLFRLSSKDLEKSFGFKSSVVVFSEKTIIGSAFLAFLLAILSYSLVSLTILGPKFLLPLFLSGALLPVYVKALEDPEHIQFKKMKKIVYLHFYGFAVLFAIVAML